MEALLRDKFARNVTLRGKLLATGERRLVHANAHGDAFWGECCPPSGGPRAGRNELGLALTRLRSALQKASSSGDESAVARAWARDRSRPLVEGGASSSKGFSPSDVRLTLAWRRSGSSEASFLPPFEETCELIVGRHEHCDVPLEHKSCSRAHAAVLADVQRQGSRLFAILRQVFL